MKKVNLIIPLNGNGTRFGEFSEPKPLIKILNKEMIFWLLDNLNLTNVRKVFIPYNRKLKKYNFEQIIYQRYGNKKIHLICLENDTRGAAETLKQTVQVLAEKEKKYNFMCFDCDTFYFEDVIDKYINSSNKNIIYYFEDNTPAEIYSFIEIDKNRVINISEKQRISNFANCGIFCFKDAHIIEKYCNLLIYNNIRQKNEFYISGIYKLLIESKIVVNAIKINNFNCVGTPEQMRQFVETKK